MGFASTGIEPDTPKPARQVRKKKDQMNLQQLLSRVFAQNKNRTKYPIRRQVGRTTAY